MKVERLIGLIVVAIVLVSLLWFFNQKQPPSVASSSVSEQVSFNQPVPQPKANHSVSEAPVGAAVQPKPALKKIKPMSEPSAPMQQNDRHYPPVVTAVPVKPNHTVHHSTPKPMAGQWALQLGTFGDAVNAKRLVKRIRAAGEAAYSQSINIGGKSYTQVFVGPLASDAEAKAMKSKIDHTYHLASQIIHH